MNENNIPKPWERSFRNYRIGNQNFDSSGFKSNKAALDASSIPFNHNMNTNDPPPLPPRPNQSSSNNYGSGFSNNRIGGLYGSYSTSPYNLHNFNQSYYGMFNNDSNNWMLNFAGDGPKHILQSIESVLRTISSVNMMLQSTFQAIFHSFQAIIGVANHLSQTKAQLGQIFAALSIIRFLKKIYYKLLSVLGYRKNYSLNEAWKDVGSTTSLNSDNEFKKTSNWPIMIFFAAVFGVPWLICKLQSWLLDKKSENAWKLGLTEHYTAVGQFDFSATNQMELSFKRGQSLMIAPKEKQPSIRGWLLACTIDGQNSGLVPANYVKILNKAKSNTEETSNCTETPFNEELNCSETTINH